MLVYYFVPFIVSNRYLLFGVSNVHNSVTVQIRTHVYMNFFHHKDLGNHLLQLCPKVVKHPVCVITLEVKIYSGYNTLEPSQVFTLNIIAQASLLNQAFIIIILKFVQEIPYTA